LSSLKASTVMRLVRAGESLRMDAASAVQGVRGVKGGVPTFHGVALLLLPEKNLASEARRLRILQWILEDEVLCREIDPQSFEDLLGLLRDEFRISVAVSPLVPPALMRVPLHAASPSLSTLRERGGDFGAYLREAFRGVGLAVKVSPEGEGLSVVPLGKAIGLDDETVRRRLADYVRRWVRGEEEGSEAGEPSPKGTGTTVAGK
ncbi:MAG: hypothetical protein ACYTHN_16110, partial [Planctomycetota bacterium]